ncbi:toxin-antitoxin system YwqK family antitoxin [Tenacibaculum jejuense]|uniref:Toxin-antitoxin system YwqK family antitoxin n=1 Tax=Tenacibaculum jejuense TaxID=584609 RepID=A0A238UCP2_9FLAO|nr:hypothetical protein [Tenacibaculum jejuense]SNR16338.1 protein of unknown function [Tenacibaculum jejuense]
MYKTFLSFIMLGLILMNCDTKKNNKKEITPKIKKEIRKEYWDNGVLASEGIYSHGKANGPMKWFHQNGKLAGEGLMLNDKREGLWKVYESEFGKLSAEGSFKAGIKHGKWKIFYENGALWKEQFWDNNSLITNIEWDKNGEITTNK